MRGKEAPSVHASHVKLVALVLLASLALASHAPAYPTHPFRFLRAQGADSMERDDGSGRARKRQTDGPAPADLEWLKLENDRLRRELRKLKTENEHLKSWPDHGESVLTDDDA